MYQNINYFDFYVKRKKVNLIRKKLVRIRDPYPGLILASDPDPVFSSVGSEPVFFLEGRSGFFSSVGSGSGSGFFSKDGSV